jgi:glutamyl-tRNA synthetase
MRKNAEAKKENFHFKSPWRDKFNSQSSNVKPVIRIKAPLDGQTIINDLVQGEVRVNNSELDDLVMLRGDGTPTYMLAVVVDDFDMKITHIIRGDDHLNNAFRQKVIYDAMNWPVPQFAHIPLIHGADGAKMSKRHGATSVIEYKEMGYLPEAMRNYLLRLGFGGGDNEIISDFEAAKIFDISKVVKSPSRFDFAKLNHVNKFYIKEKTNEELFELIKEFLPQKISQNEKEKIIKALKFLKEKPATLREIASGAEIYLDDFKMEIDEESLKILNEKKDLLKDLKNVFENLNDYSHDGIKSAINEYANLKGLKIKDFGPALRVALTFCSASAGGIFDVVEVLGKSGVLGRLGWF